jgi:hypothetical protein
VSEEIRKLADAVLYEGYLLWPYRRSAFKNQKRWTFGGVFPPAHNADHPDDLAAIQAQCLLEAAEPRLEVDVRFLHVVARQVVDAAGRAVDELVVGGERFASWDEATEREVHAEAGCSEIAIPAGSQQEPLDGGARIVRTWQPLRATVRVAAELLRERLFRVTVRIANETPWAGGEREDALRRALCSTHALVHAPGGAFVSPADPPPELAEQAAGCENVGVWPVLVGEEGARDTVLASPIILSDYPRIAPESPGDLFDGGEIDRLLILNVLSLTPEEQEEMRATDPRAREILERCASLGPEELLPLHGRLTRDGA